MAIQGVGNQSNVLKTSSSKTTESRSSIQESVKKFLGDLAGEVDDTFLGGSGKHLVFNQEPRTWSEFGEAVVTAGVAQASNRSHDEIKSIESPRDVLLLAVTSAAEKIADTAIGDGAGEALRGVFDYAANYVQKAIG